MPDQPSLFLDDAYPEVLGDIARSIHESLMKHPTLKVPHPIAAEMAMAAAEHVRKNIGGAIHYIPRGMSYEATLREREIWAAFKGDNYAEVARRWHITEMRVRQIIASVARADRAARQQNLFGETGND